MRIKCGGEYLSYNYILADSVLSRETLQLSSIFLEPQKV